MFALRHISQFVPHRTKLQSNPIIVFYKVSQSEHQVKFQLESISVLNVIPQFINSLIDDVVPWNCI